MVAKKVVKGTYKCGKKIVKYAGKAAKHVLFGKIIIIVQYMFISSFRQKIENGAMSITDEFFIAFIFYVSIECVGGISRIMGGMYEGNNR